MKNFDIIKNRKIIFIIVAAILVIGITSMIIQGFNIDIDFSGGTEIQLDLGQEVTSDICNKINDIIEEKLGKQYVSSTTKSLADSYTAIIRTGTSTLTNEQQKTLLDALEDEFDIQLESNSYQINSVSATVGGELLRTAILSVVIAVALMLIYISFRFKFASAVAAITCLTHDVFVMMALYSLLQIPINTNIIAALLTILGYSINATIVIFDRVRENRKRLNSDEASFDEVIAISTRQSLTRSINTTVTTLLTIGMIYIMGVESIRNFALPLIIGMIAGLFSSICLAGNIWAILEKVIPDGLFAKLFKKESKKKAR